MRVNANRKVHQMKRDPFKVLTKLVIFLLVFMVVGVGVFAFVSTGNGKAALEKWKGTFRELGGSVTGKKK